MDANVEREDPLWRKVLSKVLSKIKAKFSATANAHQNRIRRQKAVVALLTHRLPFIKLALFLLGYVWMLSIPSTPLSMNTYIDENALQPAQVSTYWNWGDVHAADRYLEQLEALKHANATSIDRAQVLRKEFSKLGLSASTQEYSFSLSSGVTRGANAYAVISSPRGSGTEAMVVSASWASLTDEGDGMLNLRGISTVLALAGFLKRYSLWAKDIVFVISDGHLDGMHAWLSAYHGSTQQNLVAEELKISSGVIWAALNIDYPGHSFSHLGIFFEGINGRLPNQDLLNSFERISRYTGGVPVTVYDHLHPQEDTINKQGKTWIPSMIRNHQGVISYAYHARNVVRHLKYQARGRASGVHGLFHQFRIDAITIFAVPSTGPHGFHAIGRVVESTLRTMNNLLERLHASFFFFILTGPERFIKIGGYLPSAILISVAMMFQGLGTWVDAAWVLDDSEESSQTREKASNSPLKWRKRRRPVIPALLIMAATHTFGGLLFFILTRSWFMKSCQILSPTLFIFFAIIPLLTLTISKPTSENAPLPTVLKALNLCFASTVISITAVLNFSLAVFFSVLLGVPLAITSSSSAAPIRALRYAAHLLLGFGWLFLGQEEMKAAILSWEVLSVWFAPVICLVYVPLVLQASIVCILPSCS
ncbi:uncharacterized protein LACBIDRAFT_306134 [Laccaria bicolor S238N-H82]|uniref:Predicted protein n=1 Tax=Laccaria bicolor (strain S238N-H82 / ATCC MYA-4686) TaxID=486041 RepID=B0CSU0_LACBS|nr:uncharacterized protein LACBIDRAFT_306134 [Laccaria bicolor S238N-H82]EDR14899.1 predicted protein [Laccaria bicolor S238N-H82]|eukprot:XP_001875458.1 predicted protein [Laccaria bicolor S238N-H82]